MSAPNVTLAELMAAIEQAQRSQDSDAGLTSREIMEVTNWGEDKCRRLLRNGIEAGLIRPGIRRCVDMTGRPQNVPCYIPVPK